MRWIQKCCFNIDDIRTERSRALRHSVYDRDKFKCDEVNTTTQSALTDTGHWVSQ